MTFDQLMAAATLCETLSHERLQIEIVVRPRGIRLHGTAGRRDVRYINKEFTAREFFEVAPDQAFDYLAHSIREIAEQLSAHVAEEVLRERRSA